MIGAVTAPSYVSVDVQNQGSLLLENGPTPTNSAGGVCSIALCATKFHIESGGTLSLGVTEALAATGVVTAKDSVILDPAPISASASTALCHRAPTSSF